MVSLLMGCGTLNESRKKNWNNPRIAHFQESPEIKKSEELIIRTPTLDKLKVIKPQIIKAHKKEEVTSETEQKDNSKQIAEIIEEEKPYDGFNLAMVWVALLSSCGLVWCSIWFAWRWFQK
jgi:hypothetical protein